MLVEIMAAVHTLLKESITFRIDRIRMSYRGVVKIGMEIPELIITTSSNTYKY